MASPAKTPPAKQVFYKKAQVEKLPAGQKRYASNQLRVMAFCDSYRREFSVTKAAIAAGYTATAASAMGSRLLRDPRVQEVLSRMAMDAVALSNVKVQDILQATSEIAYLDPGQCFAHTINAKTGVVTLRLKDLPEMPLEVRRCIASFKVVKKNLVSGDAYIDTIIEVKFWNKLKALELLAQHKGALTAKAEEVATVRQLEKMSDEDLAKTLREGTETWNKHVAARARMRLAVNTENT